jgi:hypothetical protein
MRTFGSKEMRERREQKEGRAELWRRQRRQWEEACRLARQEYIEQRKAELAEREQNTATSVLVDFSKKE